MEVWEEISRSLLVEAENWSPIEIACSKLTHVKIFS